MRDRARSIGKQSLHVYELGQDGLVHKGGTSYELGSLQVAGQMIDINHIVKAEDDPEFLYGVRTMACCNAAVKKNSLLLVSDRHFVVPCYACEVWSHWKRHNSGGYDLSMGWFRRRFQND